MAFTVTPQMLLDSGVDATCDDFKSFCAEWPEGAEITAKNIARAQELGLPIGEAADCLPAPAREVYEEARAPAG